MIVSSVRRHWLPSLLALPPPPPQLYPAPVYHRDPSSPELGRYQPAMSNHGKSKFKVYIPYLRATPFSKVIGEGRLENSL